MIRSYAQRVDYNNAVDILLVSQGGASRAFGLPVVFQAEDREGRLVEPTLRLHTDEAQQLMDALWTAGLRPTEGQGSAGSLAATERRLADMRGILQKQGVL